MIEIYLFINPLDESSLKVEEKFLRIIHKETEKVHFRLIPLVNPRVIQQYIKSHDLPLGDLDNRNKLCNSIYSACLDYKALQLQGKKLSRQFLFELQKKVGRHKENYSTQLVHQILTQINADLTLFKHDRESNLIVDFFRLDQQVANEMGIESFSDAVIFNYNCDRDFGVLVEADTPDAIIEELFKTHCDTSQFSTDDDRLHLY